MGLNGFATTEGTRRFAQRFAGVAAPGHFRSAAALSLSSIGLGTYLGHDDDADDGRYQEAALMALERGVNVLDSAINYRSQRSERALGAALARAIAHDGWLSRDEVFVASKAGFIPFDGQRPASTRADFEARFVRRGLFTWADVAAGCHCLAPRFLEDQLETSRRNLGLATIDLYYLHNPETQLEELSVTDFELRMRAAFEVCERAVADGRLRFYGTATWSGYRVPTGAKGHLDFARLQALAREVGGERHRFRFVQLPLNLGMAEAFRAATQARGGRAVPALEAISPEAYVMTSASILQGKLVARPPAGLGAIFPEAGSDAARALQAVRSTPGVTTALVGMKQSAHVEANLALVRAPIATPAAVDRAYAASRG